MGSRCLLGVCPECQRVLVQGRPLQSDCMDNDSKMQAFMLRIRKPRNIKVHMAGSATFRTRCKIRITFSALRRQRLCRAPCGSHRDATGVAH